MMFIHALIGKLESNCGLYLMEMSCVVVKGFILYCLSCQLAVKNLSKHFEFFMNFLVFSISISTFNPQKNYLNIRKS